MVTHMNLLSFLDISMETANIFYKWGWKASLLGAVITLISVSLLMMGTIVRDHEFKAKMSQLNTDAAKANERAAQLENDAAKAKEKTARLEVEAAKTKEAVAQADARAAEANKKAEEERVERLKLEAKVSWRRLSPEQHGNLVKALSNCLFSMYFEYSQSDPEAVQFAEDIVKSLKDASGINVYPPHPLTMPPAPSGVTVSGSPSINRAALESALVSAGIKFRVGENATGEPRISVGSRPSPF